jgi:pectate lyase
MARRLGPKTVLTLMALACGAVSLPAQTPEGFGENTTGGEGHPVFTVTTLADYDPTSEPVIAGSLRDALSASDRRIHFAVAGNINLKRKLEIRNRANITVDGSTAPLPGITVRLDQIEIRDSDNIIVRHIRVRDSADRGSNIPGVMIYRDCTDIWLAHISVRRSSDESMAAYGSSIGNGRPTNVTISWNLLADAVVPGSPNSGKGILISGTGSKPAGNPVTGEMADRITIHHNILSNNHMRNPQISGNTDAGTGEPFVDLRNNILHDWYVYGTRIRWGATANVVKNIYRSAVNPEDALVLVEEGPLYTSGNDAPLQVGGMNLNTMGSEASALSAPPITEHSVANLAAALIGDGIGTGAGALPRDAVDNAIIEEVAADLAAFLSTCSQLGGVGCAFGDACTGSFEPTSDFGSLCCAGGTCTAPPDSDGDGVADALDDCPDDPNPGQWDRDGDGVGNKCDDCPRTSDPFQDDADGDGIGDACDMTITQPLSLATLDCRTPGIASTRPRITWDPGDFDRYRVQIAWDPSFGKLKRVTSGATLLKRPAWRPARKTWRRACRNTLSTLYIRVIGLDRDAGRRDPRRRTLCDVVQVGTLH